MPVYVFLQETGGYMAERIALGDGAKFGGLDAIEWILTQWKQEILATPQEIEQSYSVSEAAEYLELKCGIRTDRGIKRISKATISGKLPSTGRLKEKRIKKSDIDQYIKDLPES